MIGKIKPFVLDIATDIYWNVFFSYSGSPLVMKVWSIQLQVSHIINLSDCLCFKRYICIILINSMTACHLMQIIHLIIDYLFFWYSTNSSTFCLFTLEGTINCEICRRILVQCTDTIVESNMDPTALERRLYSIGVISEDVNKFVKDKKTGDTTSTDHLTIFLMI